MTESIGQLAGFHPARGEGEDRFAGPAIFKPREIDASRDPGPRDGRQGKNYTHLPPNVVNNPIGPQAEIG